VADPGLGDQIEAFLRNALDQKRLEDRLVREALSSLRQTLVGIERTLNRSGILSPGPGRDEQIKRLVAAVANSVAEVAASSTVAGLPASPAVGMLTRVTDATAPAVGSTVAGGGAAAALVWWNGTNWTVIGV